MTKKIEHFKQAHLHQSLTSSLTLSTLTNSVYQMSDVWNMANSLSSYCLVLHNKIEEANMTNEKILRLRDQFEELKKNDFDAKLEEHKKKWKNNKHKGNDVKMVENLMEDVYSNINKVLKEINKQMKSDEHRNDITNFVYILLNDDALIRSLLFHF